MPKVKQRQLVTGIEVIRTWAAIFWAGGKRAAVFTGQELDGDMDLERHETSDTRAPMQAGTKMDSSARPGLQILQPTTARKRQRCQKP